MHAKENFTIKCIKLILYNLLNNEKKKTILLITFKRKSNYLLFIHTDCSIIKIRILIFIYRLVISKSSKKNLSY